jgi:hypothetical protein
MKKLSLSIDVSKLDKSRIKARTYTNNKSEQVTEQNIDVEVLPLKTAKILKQTSEYVFSKTHAVVLKQTKEEKAAKVPYIYVGSGFQFDKPTPTDASQGAVDYPSEDINAEDIPF